MQRVSEERLEFLASDKYDYCDPDPKDMRSIARELLELRKAIPDECPITRRKLFSTMTHPDLGEVPVYGGPYDSYTQPHLDDDGELRVYRYDQDEGAWTDGTEGLGIYVFWEQDALEHLDEAAVKSLFGKCLVRFDDTKEPTP